MAAKHTCLGVNCHSTNIRARGLCGGCLNSLYTAEQRVPGTIDRLERTGKILPVRSRVHRWLELAETEETSA